MLSEISIWPFAILAWKETLSWPVMRVKVACLRGALA